MKSHLSYYMTGWGFLFGAILILQIFFPPTQFFLEEVFETS